MASLLELVEALVRDPGAKAAYRADPDDFLDRHGFGGLEPADLEEALHHAADSFPPPLAAQVSPAGGLDSLVPVDLDELGFDDELRPQAPFDDDGDGLDGPAAWHGPDLGDDVDFDSPFAPDGLEPAHPVDLPHHDPAFDRADATSVERDDSADADADVADADVADAAADVADADADVADAAAGVADADADVDAGALDAPLGTAGALDALDGPESGDVDTAGSDGVDALDSDGLGADAEFDSAPPAWDDDATGPAGLGADSDDPWFYRQDEPSFEAPDDVDDDILDDVDDFHHDG